MKIYFHYFVRLSEICISLVIIIVFATGCGKKSASISFPLQKGNFWTYSGEYISTFAGKTIRHPVHNHCLSIGEVLQIVNGQSYLILTISLEGSCFNQLLIRKSDMGVVFSEGNAEILLFPEKFNIGEFWDVTIWRREQRFRAVKFEEVKVPSGTYNCILIKFDHEKSKLEGKIWCADKIGIVAFELIDREERPPRNLRLELKRYEVRNGDGRD